MRGEKDLKRRRKEKEYTKSFIYLLYLDTFDDYYFNFFIVIYIFICYW